uniref:Androglobin n=1 Tax=Rousettus aegyptiacus TaxID=9407 RepID=A0A7J8K4A7_ROUAE|nr:androglobin [Rousettus aegyptiacus]
MLSIMIQWNKCPRCSKKWCLIFIPRTRKGTHLWPKHILVTHMCHPHGGNCASLVLIIHSHASLETFQATPLS